VSSSDDFVRESKIKEGEMSAVINMQQRRTRAHGRQNRDPNTGSYSSILVLGSLYCPEITAI